MVDIADILSVSMAEYDFGYEIWCESAESLGSEI